MGERQTIVICGAGIGGLVAALAIAEAGYHVVVCERAEELTEIGAGIQLSPNAGRILAGLGLEKAIGDIAIQPKAIDVRNGKTGRVVASIPVDAFRDRYGYPYQVIHRAALQAVLAKAVRRRHDAELRFGAVIGDVLSKRGMLFVKTQKAGGSELIAASGLIGADGVWSATRGRIAGASEPRSTGRTAWRAVIPLDNAPASLAADRVTLWLGSEAHLVHYPVADGAAINVVANVEEEWDKPGWTAPGDRVWLLERFGAWTTEVRELLNAPFSWLKWAITAVDPGGPWTDGAVALLGDAAHAMPPFLAQGAAMAIEDAAVLGRALGAAPDVAAGFHAYEAERKPRVTRVWKAARRSGEHYHLGPRMAALRDLALGVAGPAIVLRQNDWIYRWQPE